MTYLTRGPGGTPGIGSKGHASREPTPFSALIVDPTGGDSMTHLTRGPGGTPGIGSKAHASREPTPVGCAHQYRSGGDSMSQLASLTTEFHQSPTFSQAAP